jgi:competence protein ComEC
MKKKIFFLLILVMSIIAGVVVFSDSDSKIVFFDIGQGDSIYIELKGNYQVLIDGGPTSAVLEKLGNEMPFYDREVEIIVLTHPDKDHLFGLLEVLKRYEVKNVVWTGVVKNSSEYREWLDLLEKENARVIVVSGGEKIILQKDPLVFLEIIYPIESFEGREIKDVNDTSIVAKLVSKEKEILLTGDISKKVEKELVEKYNLKSDILKVSHHGSKSSTCSEFVEAVDPEMAIISVGENNWGHPSYEVLQTLKEFGIQVLTTKELGNIKINF